MTKPTYEELEAKLAEYDKLFSDLEWMFNDFCGIEAIQTGEDEGHWELSCKTNWARRDSAYSPVRYYDDESFKKLLFKAAAGENKQRRQP